MEMIIEFLTTLSFWQWFIIALCLIIVEILAGANFFLLWMALSAATVGGLLWLIPTLSWELQWVIFGAESLACIVFWFAYLKNHPTESDKPRLNRRSEQYIGRTFTLKEDIVNGRGKISVDDSTWRVDGPDLPAGAKVTVVDVNGVVLIVKEATD